VALLNDPVNGIPKKKAGAWFTEKMSAILQTAELHGQTATAALL